MKHQAFGHVEFKLSELDIRMVKSVPQGGNWKNIPEEIPSKRLEQIRISGGRTTLYGRLSWAAPSYTVTTYFNRPGNGCYVHPDLDRVITALEAARLQSFPDSYRFKGSKTSLTKQIGNAVPPLLAFEIGKKIRARYPNITNVVDLFAGAGGLSTGLEWAGLNPVVANDFFPAAAETYRHNHERVHFIEGDITLPEIREGLSASIERIGDVGMIAGGPPCQGFSHAGLRMIDDPRNTLYKHFVDLVARHHPKIVLMENVEGILSINGGKTYTEIKQHFADLGYAVEGRKLHAAAYGVPQRRKRVVIIGVLDGDPSELFPDPILDMTEYVNVREAMWDLKVDTVESLELGVVPEPATSAFQEFAQGVISPAEYSKSLKTRH